MYNWGVDVLSVYGKHLKPAENRLAMLQMSTWRNAAFCSLSDTFTSLSLPQRSIPQYQMAMQDPMVDEGQVSLAQSDLTGVYAKRTQPLTTSFIWCCQFKHPPVHDKTQTNDAPIISPTVVSPITSGVLSAHRSASSWLLKSFTSSRKSSGPSRYATLGHTMFDRQLTAWETPRILSVSDFWVYKTTPPTPKFISFSRRISWVTGRLPTSNAILRSNKVGQTVFLFQKASEILSISLTTAAVKSITTGFNMNDYFMYVLLLGIIE